MKSNTAVEWYSYHDNNLTILFIEGKITATELLIKKQVCLNMALEMEKEQMIKTTLFWSHSQVRREQVVEYINETYGGNE